MSRRLEVELTSQRDDGNWTWRAAGARQPKGELTTALVPDGTKVGDVLKVEADVDIDGITIMAVAPPREGPARAGTARDPRQLASGGWRHHLAAQQGRAGAAPRQPTRRPRR